MLVRVADCALLVELIAWLPKDKLSGETVTAFVPAFANAPGFEVRNNEVRSRIAGATRERRDRWNEPDFIRTPDSAM